jgi:hypothetical protein
MSNDKLPVYQAQMKALAAVREACAAMAPGATPDGLYQLAQALQIVVELEEIVLEKQQPIKAKNPYAS